MKIRVKVVCVLLMLIPSMMLWSAGTKEQGSAKTDGAAVITIWDFKYGDVQGVDRKSTRLNSSH